MSTTPTDTQQFSTANLAIFERHGAKVATRDGRAGCRITLPDGWALSVQWGPCMYGTNYDARFGPDDSGLVATEAEIAVIDPADNLVEWVDGDTVQGWCSMDRVQGVLDALAAGKLAGADGRLDDGKVSS